MARKQGHNRSNFEDKLKNEINLQLRKTIADPRLTMVSVTRVVLNNDYSLAKVYWDTYDPTKRGDIKIAFDGVTSKLRGVLAKTLQVRHTPRIEFFYDSQFEDERNIESLLGDSSNEDS